MIDMIENKIANQAKRTISKLTNKIEVNKKKVENEVTRTNL